MCTEKLINRIGSRAQTPRSPLIVYVVITIVDFVIIVIVVVVITDIVVA